MLPRVEYIEWIVGRHEEAVHDLATSDLGPGRPDADRVVPDRLSGLDDPDPAVTLEALVADVYGVDPSRVVATAGATHAYWLAVAAALAGDGGDRVLVERPGYEPLYRVPEAQGARVGRFERSHSEGYALSADRITAAGDPDTALVVATNRHNPSGRLADREALAAAAAAAADVGARLLVDEVYAAYTNSPVDGAFGGPTAAGRDGTVVVGSLSKFHGLGGLKVGWVIADEDFLTLVRRVFAHLPVRSATSVALARRALGNRERIEPESRARVGANHALLADFVADREDLSGRVFDGATFAFPAHDAGGDDVVEAAWERDLLVVPGRFFGVPDRFRVSLGGPPAEVADALDVLGESLDAV